MEIYNILRYYIVKENSDSLHKDINSSSIRSISYFRYMKQLLRLLPLPLPESTARDP